MSETNLYTNQEVQTNIDLLPVRSQTLHPFITETNSDVQEESDDEDIDNNISEEERIDLLKKSIEKRLTAQGLTAQKLYLESECAICTDKITKKNFCAFSKCGHVLCSSCPNNIRQHIPLRQQTGSNQSVICPYCQVSSRCVFSDHHNIEALISQADFFDIPLLPLRSVSCFTGHIIHQNTIGSYDFNHQTRPEDTSGILSISPIIDTEQIEVTETNAEPYVILQESAFEFEGVSQVVIGLNVQSPIIARINSNQDYIVVLDTSGSMCGYKINNMKKALSDFVSQVPKGSRVGMICFADSSYQLFPIEPSTPYNKTKWNSLINRLYANGGTSYTAGLSHTIKMITHASITGPNRPIKVLVLGDGGGDLSEEINNKLIATEASVYGISIGGDVSCELFQRLLRHSFSAGHYAHVESDNACEQFSAMGFSTETLLSNVTITVIGGRPDSSLAVQQGDEWILYYPTISEGIIRIPIIIESDSPLPIISVNYSFGPRDSPVNKIIQATIIEPTPENRLILEQLIRYRRNTKRIMDTLNENRLTNQMLISIRDNCTEELYGDNTETFRILIERLIQGLQQRDNTVRNVITETLARESSVGTYNLNRSRSGF